jgi:hypothetical protein
MAARIDKKEIVLKQDEDIYNLRQVTPPEPSTDDNPRLATPDQPPT